MDPFKGMTDPELVKLCKPHFDSFVIRLDWSAEIYSFGKCFRDIYHFPKVLPLAFTTDHGVGMETTLFPHESNRRPGLHMTWNKAKFLRYQNQSKTKMAYVMHPWIAYRRKYNIQRKENHKGTLVYFTHHVPGIEWKNHDSDAYFERLKSLPEKFHPIVFCVHMHDINANNHQKIRSHGFSIVTAGNSSSNDFVDRFYEIISNFSYATSQSWGSQTAYCVEMGVPYFFLGDRPILINYTYEDFKKGEVGFLDDFHEKNEQKADAIFSTQVDEVTFEQRQFVEDFIGNDSPLSHFEVTCLIWKQFFKNVDVAILDVLKRVKNKIGVLV